MVIENVNYEYRTGIGTDIHRTVEGKPLKLCGVLVESPFGLLAHSDGDVGLHAVIDALFGAAGIGDIGTFFPDSDPQFKGVDSKDLVLRARDYVTDVKWEVVNVDVIITAEEPRLEAYKMQMKRTLASLLGIDFLCVNVKAKTNEALDAVGQGLAISAMATVLIKRKVKR